MVDRKTKTRRMSLIGMMIAITAILAFTPLGLIPLPLASASTLQIPTIIIAILEGPLMGGIVGAAMGVITLIRALLAPAGILDPYFINPIISVLPRILIGVASGWCYRGLCKAIKKDSVNFAVSGAVGAMVNTCLVMGLLYVIYLDTLTAQFASIGMAETVKAAFLGVVATSGVAELIASAVLCTVITAALKRVFYKGRKGAQTSVKPKINGEASI